MCSWLPVRRSNIDVPLGENIGSASGRMDAAGGRLRDRETGTLACMTIFSVSKGGIVSPVMIHLHQCAPALYGLPES